MINETLEAERAYHKGLSEEYYRGYRAAKDEIVHCENCKHWSDSNQCARPELSGNRWHDAKYFDTLPDDYCSYGERREE